MDRGRPCPQEAGIDPWGRAPASHHTLWYGPPMLRAAMLPLVCLVLTACPEPDSVEMGYSCKETVECKAPADSCVTAIGKKLCTAPCDAENVCPEGFVCARMDIKVTEGGVGGKSFTGEAGYCLPSADVPPRAAKIRPKKKGKNKKKKGGGG